MSMSQRISRIRKGHQTMRHQFNQQAVKVIHRRPVGVFQKGPAKLREMAATITDHWLATQRKPLEEVEPIALLRWLLRRYFEWRGFACRSHVCNNEDGRHKNGRTVACPKCAAPVAVLCDGKCYASIEYRGTFENESDGRWAANCSGGEVKPIPFSAALPEETVSYGVGDVPQSEASGFYRKGVRLPFAAIPRNELDDLPRNKLARLAAKVRETDPIVEGFRAKVV